MTDWLRGHSVTAAAMEGTGVYWKAPFEALEDAGIHADLLNAQHVKQISIKTITKLLLAAGEACAAHHDEHVRALHRTSRIQADEIWSFTYAKEKNVKYAKAAPPEAGDTWTWLAMDADHKLVISWAIGPRDLNTAYGLMTDLAERLVNRVQLTTDGLTSYLPAVEDVFGAGIDFAQLIKMYGTGKDTDENTTSARYSPPHVSRYARGPGSPAPRTRSTLRPATSSARTSRCGCRTGATRG